MMIRDIDVETPTGNGGSIKPNVICSACGAENSIKWNKIEIEIGDKKGTVADISFNYCDECGWAGELEWY